MNSESESQINFVHIQKEIKIISTIANCTLHTKAHQAAHNNHECLLPDDEYECKLAFGVQ